MCNISYYSIIFPAEGVTTHLFPCSDCHAVMWSLYACCIGKELGEPLLGWPVLFKIVKGIAEGIAYIHKSKYVRQRESAFLGDLKPSDIFLDSHANPKISNIGISRILEGQRYPHVYLILHRWFIEYFHIWFMLHCIYVSALIELLNTFLILDP